ncbi:TIGR03084 family protein [Nocardioides alpinus]|uniref:TIGR03084 family protein n=1 Tax=Nocardioides alpinus TaxID=748909 RepID=A0A1I1BBU2_9ACTN|nr:MULTISPECIES: TIGR03084 family metal-binding protein [Nocardioides]SFB47819.1 TIGR03084 family protein [Nocardioides alpinus]
MTSPAATGVVPSLVIDLRDEVASVLPILDGLARADWQTPTPAVGWNVHDQVSHLAHFDHLTRLSIQSPVEFASLRDGLTDLQAYIDGIGRGNQWRDGEATTAWWRSENRELRDAATVAEPSTRVPWFGPPMSLASKLTARIVETWAHGQDVADTFGVTREPTARLAHVARIGVLAFANSFRTRGLSVPDANIRVELSAPDGFSSWSWGPEDADESVVGDAKEFCLVVTQRCHIADTALVVRGQNAQRWMTIAQAFAGQPGVGRSPNKTVPKA